MRLNYFQKWVRGWGVLLDFILVMFVAELFILVAFLPCYILAGIGTLLGDSLNNVLRTIGVVIMAAYILVVGPVALWYLVRIFGYPWRWVDERRQPKKVDNPEATTSAQ